MLFLKVTLGKNNEPEPLLCSTLEIRSTAGQKHNLIFTKQTKDFREHIKRQKKMVLVWFF